MFRYHTAQPHILSVAQEIHMSMPIATPEFTRFAKSAISRRLDEINATHTPATARAHDAVIAFISMPEGMGARRLAHLAYAEACSLLHVADL